MTFLSSPLALLVGVLVVLGLWALYVAVAAGLAPAKAAAGQRRGGLPAVLARERRQAAELGMSERIWWTVRVAGLAGGLAAGLWLGTPRTIVGGIVLGAIGVPYLLADRAEKRRLAMEQALVEMVRTVTSLVRSSRQTLDAALTDQGHNPHPALRTVLAPLAETQRSIGARLVDVDGRATCPIANRICLDLLIALSITPEAFLDVAIRVLLPQYERDLEIQRRNRAVSSAARTTVYVVVGLMALMLFVVLRNPTLRAPYVTPLGQSVLLAVAGLVVAILFLIHAMTPRTEWVRWDLARMDALLERRYG